ncbi:hypothetical protein ACJVC5_19030 [Peredibacter sp. HCB2-198]|uniref:hypothetical protein n=1 Tax=Peredibacter sp. HCB2-198 TaxID=3383025 RepID=UPI0038B64316
MTRILALLFLSLFLVACNKDGAGDDCTATAQAEETGSTTDCTVTQPPVEGETTGSTDGGTTGSTTGSTTGGGTTGSTTGGTTGSTTGGTTGGSTGGLPTEAYTFDTDIFFVNTTSTQQAKFDKAIEMIKAVVATETFRDRVLNHTYNGKKTFVDNGGYTNAQIYQKILEAAERLYPEKNNTMNMEVELYYAATSTVGYTYANSKRIWVNTKYFNTNSTGGVAANLFHEWLHKIGFTHATSYSTSRDYSVPYAIGRMISSIGSAL